MLRRHVVSLFVALGALSPLSIAKAGPCSEPADAHIWWSPESPVVGETVRLLAVREEAGDAQLVRIAGKKVDELATTARGGPPYSFASELPAVAGGAQRIELRAGGKVIACHEIPVAKSDKVRPRRKAERTFWKTTRAWDRATENFYAAWVESLFDAPVSESLNFRPLTPAMRDPKRNFFYDHLGLREDDPKNKEAIPAEPDCADLPYFLRGYFAWKLGLPMGFRDCNRGSATAPPRCGALFTNEAPSDGKTPLKQARTFLRKLANTAQSGSARTGLEDENTDYYPVKLTRAALRPGTTYADPYGHVLVAAKWVPQTSSAGGLLLAVDGQPDGSVGRKRFWEGTFLFASGEKSAGPGWKAFRPLVRQGDTLVPMNNAALAVESPAWAPFSREQESVNPEAFYARMSKLINPRGLPPKVAYEETLAALVEQLETRIGSVDNGEKYMAESKGAVVPMPEGPKIFETVGPWEDYATPSRDMRLIIAMNVLEGLPDQVVRHPELFVLGGRKPEEGRQEIRALHERLTKERSIEYKRSDGSSQRLTVADLLARKAGFEIAYDPNDCVEVRWAAPEGSPEMSTCQRHAPADQKARLAEYRSWFHEARRPAR